MRCDYLDQIDKNKIKAIHLMTGTEAGKGLITLRDVNELLRHIGTKVDGCAHIVRKTKHLKEHCRWSKKAKRIVNNPDRNGKLWGQGGLLHCEHIVPVSILWKMLPEGPDAKLEDLEEVFAKYLEIVVITKDESDIMDKPKSKGGLGIKSSMPDNWDGKDKYARIRAADIKMEDKI